MFIELFCSDFLYEGNFAADDGHVACLENTTQTMKTIYKGIMAATALAAVSMAIPAMSSALQGDRLVKAERLQPKSQVPSQKKDVSRLTPAGTPYWQTARSIYNEKGQNDPDNGVTREFGTHIEIDGETARIYGLVNVNPNNYYEIDEEYAVEGVYDANANTITVTGTIYDESKPLDEYVKLAEIYSPGDDMSYTLVLIAGYLNMFEQIATVNELVFDVSDDMQTIEPQNGYGAYALTSDGQGRAFVDFYQSSTLEKAPETPNIKTDTGSLAFKGQFVAAGMPVVEVFSLMNSGASATEYAITTSSPWLTVSSTEGTVDGCSTVPIAVTFSPEEPGMFNGKITIQSGSQTIDVTVDTEVREVPDYTKIVRAGSEAMEFDMSPVYPFVISEINGNTVAESVNNGEGDGTESWFKCRIEIPEGKTGVFTWQAVQESKSPNSLVVMLDGETVKSELYLPNTDPHDMSGTLALMQGTHEIVFDNVITMDWSIYGLFQRSYVWDLNLDLIEAKDDNAMLVTDTADFGETYFDKFDVKMNSEVTVLNTGMNPLKVLSITSDGNFGGSAPEISVPFCGEIKVALTWDASAVGEDSGIVTIHTTGGDLKVNCSGLATAIAFDYSTIVKEGDFSFVTGVRWPFKPNDEGTYAYNSTSKANINGITDCWLEASFEVPEGKVGHVEWDATNDSEDMYYFLGTPSMISGSTITIDGGNKKEATGIGVDCSSSEIYSGADVTFRPGRHTVKFNYKKTANWEDFVFGDDCLKLFEIALKLTDSENGEGELSVDMIDYSEDVFTGATAHAYATLYNYTTKTPELISSECDGPFKAKAIDENDGNLRLAIEFSPVKAGGYSSELIIKTNIGDYTVSCSGTAIDSELGYAIFHEGFEYDFGNEWIITDNAGEGNTWRQTMKAPGILAGLNMTAYAGEGLLYATYFDPESGKPYNMTDTYAISPSITIPADGETTLSFMTKYYTYMPVTLEITAGTGDDPTCYDSVGTLTIDPARDDEWREYTFSLGEWAGKEIHIAFHTTQNIDRYLALDEIMVFSTGNVSVEMPEADDNLTVEYYTPDGLRHERPVKGLNIVVTRRSDGTTSTRKEWMK